MAYFRTKDGCSLYYEEVGFAPGKPVVVFLNGTMQTSLYWKALARKFRTHFGVLLYDARAQGESELGSEPLSLMLHASDLLSLLDRLNVNRAHLVGVSHGAYVAYFLAEKWPQRVEKLVMCSVSAKSSYRSRLIVRSWLEILKTGGLQAAVWSTLPHVFGESFLKLNGKVLDRMVSSVVRRNKAASLQAHLEAMQSYTPIKKVLKKLGCPMLVLSGSQDPLVTTEGAGYIAEVCGGRHIEFQGVGHSIPAEYPEAFQETVLNFLMGRLYELPEELPEMTRK